MKDGAMKYESTKSRSTYFRNAIWFTNQMPGGVFCWRMDLTAFDIEAFHLPFSIQNLVLYISKLRFV